VPQYDTTFTVGRLRSLLGISSYSNGGAVLNRTIAEFNEANDTSFADVGQINAQKIEITTGNLYLIGGLRLRLGLDLYSDGGPLQNASHVNIGSAFPDGLVLGDGDVQLSEKVQIALSGKGPVKMKDFRSLLGLPDYVTAAGNERNTGNDIAAPYIKRAANGEPLTPAQENEYFSNQVVFSYPSSHDWNIITTLLVAETAYGCEEVQIDAGNTNNFDIPLLSSIIGSRGDKYLPLFATDEGLIVEIELNQNAFYSSTYSNRKNFAIEDAQLVMQHVEFDQAVQKAVMNTISKDGIRLHASTFKTFTPSVPPDAAGRLSLMVDDRLASVRALLFGFRVTKNDTDSTQRTHGRVSRALTELYCRFGNQVYPAAPLRGNSADATKCVQFITELKKVAKLIVGEQQRGVLTRENYIVNNETPGVNMNAEATSPYTDAISPLSIGRAAYGVVLDGLPYKHPFLQSGLDMTKHYPCEIVMDGFTQQADETTNADVFLYHDVTYTIKDGGMSVSM
jgi:hypothetical protein